MPNLSLTYEEACSVLNVSPDDSEETVRRSYFKMRKNSHPDMNTSPNAETEFQKIMLAFVVWKKGPPIIKSTPTSRVYKATRTRRAEHTFVKQTNANETSLNERSVLKKTKPLMDSIIVRKKFQLHDLLQDHSITIHDVNWKECVHCNASGCNTCNYQGYKQIPWKKIIQLPRETKWSEPIIHYMDEREIKIYIDVQEHEFYRLENYDLHGVLEITCLTAMVGTTADINTLESSSSIDIPAGTQPGQLFYVRNNGLFKPDGTRGNIVLKAHITIPAIENSTLARQVYELEKFIEKPSLLTKKKSWWKFG